MEIASNWDDYEIIDASCGEKYERWGNYYLLRQITASTRVKTPKGIFLFVFYYFSWV